MCRLSAFFGVPICAADLVTRPSRSIITQSFDARERMAGDASTPGYLNGDGFGLGWYSPHPSDVTPCVYRHARPAWNDPNLGSIAEKIYTHVLFAHVRAASPGLDVSETTCHPFRMGRFLWMHNGGVGNFTAVRRLLLPTLSDDAFDFAVSHGSSDTALCFAVFLNLIRDPLAPCTPEKLRSCLQETILILERTAYKANAKETSLLNFVVSDGESIVASRYVVSPNNPNAQAASLYYASGNDYQSDGSAPGNYVMVHTDRRPSLAIISSEPLTERRGDWVPVPTNCCIVITQSMHILLSPVGHTCTPFISRILDNLSNPKLPDQLQNNSQSHFLDQVMLNPFVAQDKQTSYDSSKINGSTHSLDRSYLYNDGFSSRNDYGSTVRSTITLSGRSVICCDVMGWLLCCGTNDGSIHVWNVEDDVHTTTLRPGQSAVLAVLTDLEDGILVSASSASTISLYKFGSQETFEQKLTVSCEGKGDVLTLEKVGKKIFAGFSDGKVRCVIEDVSSSFDDLSVRNTSDFEGNDQLATHNVSLSSIGYDFPRSCDDLTHNGYVFALLVCLEGRLLCTGCGDGILRWWDVETEKCVQKRDDHAGAILALDKYETSYGTILFSGSRDCSVKVWVWDGESGFICKRTLRKHGDEVVFLKVCSDKLISGSADGAVCVWCAETLALICQYKDDGLIAGAVSPECNLLFTASNSSGVHVREVVSTEEQHLTNSRRMAQETASLNDFFEGSDSSSRAATRFSNKSINSLQHFRNKSVLSTDEKGSLTEIYERNPADVIRTEVHDDRDGVETLLPGVSNEMILGPPISPHLSKGQNLKKKLTDMMQSGSLTKLYDSQNSSPSGSDDDRQSISTRVKKSNKSFKAWTPRKLERRLMQDVLARFLSFATVSGSEELRESCWQGARYIASFLEGLGATVKFVSTSNPGDSRSGMIRTLPHLSNRSVMSASPVGSNPVVLARFASASTCARTITLYGHYDVMPVNASQWKTNPWTLTSIDGYLYGRGATDNKGPIIASLFAIKHLLEESTDGLGINIVVVLQGEGEMANRGFRDCIKSHRHWFEGTSLILTSSSSWLGESNPCITYGLRGVIELLVTMSGGTRNLHAGVDGGAIFEPMLDLIAILSKMVNKDGSVCVPGFDDDIRSLSESERNSLQMVEFNMTEYQKGTGVNRFTSDKDLELLESRWRKPSISITSIDSSNASGVFSVVPYQASAKISIRFVPDQDPQKLLLAVEDFLQTQLQKRNSPNQLTISCANIGDWWLEDPSREHFQIAARAIKTVWGIEPQYVCEGGSMPVFSFLSKTLDAPLLQVPLGQSSDGAHLPNERIRAINLFRGKEVLQRIIQEFAQTK